MSKARLASRKTGLQIRGLHVYYGHSHVLQGVDLEFDGGIHAVVGRNGMGKTTLCNAIMGLLSIGSGSIRFNGQELSGLPSYKIAANGIGYTPQGRRLWSSLTVDEHLRLMDSGGAWSVSRIYSTFPRLAERWRNGAAQLSGGEQQMLAISRALLQDPELLIFDEPTEGLAPVIVEQLRQLLLELAEDPQISILLIEQNITLATSVSRDIAIMVNGQIGRIMSSAELANDRTLQERLLGVGRHSHEDIDIEPAYNTDSDTQNSITEETSQKRSKLPSTIDTDMSVTESQDIAVKGYTPPPKWSRQDWSKRTERIVQSDSELPYRPFDDRPQPLLTKSDSAGLTSTRETIYVAGTFDTKGNELNYICACIRNKGIRVLTVDLSTSGKSSKADIPPHIVAGYYPGTSSAVFSKDRGKSIKALSEAFANWMEHQGDIAGIISAGGSGGTALVTPAMRKLPVGIPKIMISTVASGDVSQYVGPSDICMMYSVTDIQGLNVISRKVLANGANALVGMVEQGQTDKKQLGHSTEVEEKPGLGITMFGVTTVAVQQIIRHIEDQFDCLVFHATGTGGRSMEKLVDSRMLSGVIDLTTTEVCDMIVGGVMAADKDRFDSFIRTETPWIGSVGAIDMVNFGARSSVPKKFQDRQFVEHNPQVTLMRTTTEENTQIGNWIAHKVNQMQGPVRLLLPEGGVSALDAPGEAFYSPEVNEALFDAITSNIIETSKRKVVRLPCHINDPAFASATADCLQEIKNTGIMRNV